MPEARVDLLQERVEHLEEENERSDELNESLRRKVARLEIANKQVAEEADLCTGDRGHGEKILGKELKWLKHNNIRL
jgi:hypothetical protein